MRGQDIVFDVLMRSCLKPVCVYMHRQCVKSLARRQVQARAAAHHRDPSSGWVMEETVVEIVW